MYSGCSALIIGNSVKAGVRFVSYDHFKQKLADSEVWRATSLRLSFSLTCSVTVGEGQRAEQSLRFEVNLSQTLESFLPIFFFCSAGLGAGMMEAIFAVTPSETIK